MNLKEKVVLISGANSGIGFIVAKRLAQMNATVVILGRNPHKVAEAINTIQQETGNLNVHAIVADYADLDSTRKGIEEFKQSFDRLDILINNAAIVTSKREETVDGFEMHWGVNYMAHFLVTNLLLDLLQAATPSRIVNVGATQMGASLDFDDLNITKNWGQMKAVTKAKLAMFLFTREQAKRLEKSGVTVNILDPGLVKTPYHSRGGFFLKLIVKLLGQTPDKASDNYLFLATSPDLQQVTGKLYKGRKEIPFKGEALDTEKGLKLWNWTVDALQKFNTP